MNRIKTLLVCLVLLGLVGIVHHQWLQMSGSSGLVSQVFAADLQNGFGSSCNGPANWHFVNNQTEGQCGPITANFICDGGPVQITVDTDKCLSSVAHYDIQTNGNCSLVSATTGAQPGNLVLSKLTCSPSPTPTPSPSPTPSPTP